MKSIHAAVHRPAVSAVERARQAWSTMALATRTELRSMGVHRDLRTLDRMVQGTRGTQAPTQLSKLAFEMARNGIPRADAEERLTEVARVIVALAYHDGGAA